MQQSKRYFFCGLGGSGMLPLAMIARARGAAEVSGSDRSNDQGRMSDKFDWIARQGITLFPQDGSGLTSKRQILIASSAVEKSVPDVVKAKELGCLCVTRADLNVAYLNDTFYSIGVAGTSGKSTVTAMIAWILHRAGLNPTVMNGAVMRNFATPDYPFANALIGGEDYYVSEVDESDGSISQYRPYIGLLTNLTLDHKSVGELHILFTNYLRLSKIAVVNLDDAESVKILDTGILGGDCITYGFAESADVRGVDFVPGEYDGHFTLINGGQRHPVVVPMPGLHNASNALAAITATRAMGVRVEQSIAALAEFAGLARRFEVVGTTNGITVIDDFAHNPDKVTATLATLRETPGRLLIFFQPHGYGPLKQMGKYLAAAFARSMGEADKLFVCDPVYYGGTVDKSVDSKSFVADVIAGGGYAVYMSERDSCGEAIVNEARSGDRILILGARDDSLNDFAREILAGLAKE